MKSLFKIFESKSKKIGQANILEKFWCTCNLQMNRARKKTEKNKQYFNSIRKGTVLA